MRIFVVIMLLFLSTGLYAQSLNVKFTTSTINGEYSPKHIFAVWVKDKNNNFVNTLAVYAKERKGYLYRWNASSSGFKTDALTGSTLLVHQSHDISWNMKNFVGQTVSNGDYILCMEITSKDGQGPYREIEFTIDGNNFSMAPQNGSGFMNVNVTYDNGAVNSGNFDTGSILLDIVPNPVNDKMEVRMQLLKDSPVELSVLSLDGRMIFSFHQDMTTGPNRVSLDKQISILNKGTYIIMAKTDHFQMAKKFLIIE